MKSQYYEARRAYEALLRKHRHELAERDAFETADRSICPELWDAAQREPEFSNAPGALEQRLFLEVCDAYGLDAVRFDEALTAIYWDQVSIADRDLVPGPALAAAGHRL